MRWLLIYWTTPRMRDDRLCGITNIEQETIENNAAYIKSWIRTFKDDPKVLVLAAAQAQKAVDYILMHQSDGQP